MSHATNTLDNTVVVELLNAFSALTLLFGCQERGAGLHKAQLMPLPLTVSCFSKIQIGLTFLVLAHPDSPGQRAVKWLCVCTGSGIIMLSNNSNYRFRL